VWARALAGIKGYKTNLAAAPDGELGTADFIISSYDELWNIEKSKPQCSHSCGSWALSPVPSRSVFVWAA